MSTTQPAHVRRLKWSTGAVLWMFCLSCMALFQAWRGAYLDAVVFGTIVLVLTVDRTLGERLPRLGLRWRNAAGVTNAFLLLAGIVLLLVPRHGTVALLVMVSLGVGMFFAAWPSRSAHHRDLSAIVRRTAWVWGALAAVFVLWEGLTFVLSVTTPGGSEAHPTISVLLDPWLGSLLGKAVFLVAWIACGLGLLAVWRKP